MKIKNLIKILLSYPKKYTISALMIVLLVGGYFVFENKNDQNFEYITVEIGDLRQEVSVTGKVKPASKVDLAFESTGKVTDIYVDVGDKVYSGQVLARLNSDQYVAQYNQAKASLDVEQSRLNELKKGTRFEEVDVQKVKVANAEQSLLDAKNNLVVKIKDSYIKSDDAVRNKVDQLFDNPFSASPNLNIVTNFNLELKAESGRIHMEEIITSWFSSISSDEKIFNNLSVQTNLTKQNLNEISSFLDNIALIANGLSVTSTLTQTTIDGYKTAINTGRTNINTALSNIFTAEEKLKTAESTLSLEKQTLILKEAGATYEQIKEQEAKVKSAQANVDNYVAFINKTIIYSPISGIVTKVNLEKGEIAQLNTTAIMIISGAEFEVEANIPEADIAKINLGDIAQITLDAYEVNDIFEAKIISIEPAETVVEGVSTYKTVFQFTKKDQRIKSGMTANIDILTDVRKNALSIPARLLRGNDGEKVEVLAEDGKTVIEKNIETGMRSTDGRVEIISGLKEGDKVITSK